MFDNFYSVLGWVMNLFYTVIPSYGLAIMGLTVLVMVIITPLTVKSTRSMLQMQRLQPEMKRIQEKYKNDKEKLNQELMAFYQENKINPLGGCLPMLAQMPVFILMYRLMRGLTYRPGGLGSGMGHIAGQTAVGQKLTPWVYTDQFFQPEHLSPSSQMYRALTSTNKMNFLGMDLSLSASSAIKTGLLVAIPYLLLLLIMLVTGIVQNRQLQARNTSTAVNPQQQAIMKLMPFFLPVISFGFPAGLALYWCTQNLCRIGTNHYITRSVYAKAHADGPIEATATEKGGSGKGAPAKGTAKKVGPAGTDTGAAGPAKNGSKGSPNKSRTASSATSKDSPSQRGPGKSVKSQKAHEKSPDQRRSGTSQPSGSTRRKSGERRGGSSPEKG